MHLGEVNGSSVKKNSGIFNEFGGISMNLGVLNEFGGIQCIWGHSMHLGVFTIFEGI